MPTDNPTQDEKSKRPARESMGYYLQMNAERIIAEKDAKRLEELEGENFKAAYISKYQAVVAQAQNRFVDESRLCDEIFYSVKPLLQEIIEFAENYSFFPPLLNRTAEVPMQIFYKLMTPSINPELQIYFRPSRRKAPQNHPQNPLEHILLEFQNQTAKIEQEHVHGVCGIEWGFENEGNFSFYRVELTVLPIGEVKIGELTFGVAELASKEFRQGLSHAFFAPTESWNSYREMNSSENAADELQVEPEAPKSPSKKLVFLLLDFPHRVKENWRRLWDEPEFEINNETSFLKKLWYGFPMKDETAEENDE